MTMRYANEPDVLDQLKLSVDSTEDAAKVERARRLEAGVADAIDGKLGRSFAQSVAETKTVRAPGVSDLLVLPMAVRSVSDVAIGSALVGSQEYVPAFHADEGYLALRLTAYAAYWYGDVSITGVWADAAIAGGVPDLIREAATFVTVDEYRTRNASPAGEIGPDGLSVPTRNPWRFELVRQAIVRYGLRPARAGV